MKIKGEIRQARIEYEHELEHYFLVISVKTKHGYQEFAMGEPLSFDEVRLRQQEERIKGLKGKSVVVHYVFSLFGHLFGVKSIEISHVS